MARQTRFFVPGEVLHVIQRGNNREPIFAGEEDYRFFLDCLGQASRLQGVLFHAYVLMTNHLGNLRGQTRLSCTHINAVARCGRGAIGRPW